VADVAASFCGRHLNNEPLMSHTMTAVQLNYSPTTNGCEEMQFRAPKEKQSILLGCLVASRCGERPISSTPLLCLIQSWLLRVFFFINVSL